MDLGGLTREVERPLPSNHPVRPPDAIPVDLNTCYAYTVLGGVWRVADRVCVTTTPRSLQRRK